MKKIIAFIILLAAVVYYQPDGHLLYRYLLPAAGVISFVYLLTIPGSLIVLSGTVIYYFIDINSDSFLESLVLPLLLGADIILFVVWAYKAGYLAGSGMGVDAGGYGGGCGGDGGDGGC